MASSCLVPAILHVTLPQVVACPAHSPNFSSQSRSTVGVRCYEVCAGGCHLALGFPVSMVYNGGASLATGIPEIARC